MIVDLYHSGQLVRNLSSEYGFSAVTMYTSIKKFIPMHLDGVSSVTPDDYAKIKKYFVFKRRMKS